MRELTIAERVAAGAAWLDERKPDWWSAIDIIAFDIDDCRDCALGQIYGSYWDSPLFADLESIQGALFFVSDDERETIARAKPLGFYAESDETIWLNAEWERVIRARREAVSRG